jgi:zinc protease
LVVVGDTDEGTLLKLIAGSYGQLPPSTLPVEDVHPEPPQTAERMREVRKPTPTEKIVVGYHSPAIGDFDHPALSLLSEVLFGGRASRLHQKLIRKLEIASDVRAFVGPFRDPGLFELFASAREGHTGEELLLAIDEEFTRARDEPIPQEEIDRAIARFELGLLAGLETTDGKASTLGFYETVLSRPSAAFERLELTRRLTASDLRRVARRYLINAQRTVIFVRPELNAEANDEQAEEAAQ